MNVFYPATATKTLDAKMAFLKGRGAQIAAQDIAKAIEAGNARDRLAGKDRHGRPLVPLRAKRTGRYKGATGPPLAPFGPASRSVAAFRADARRRSGGWQVVAGWVGVVSARGVPFLPFHALGRGRLPRRDIFGIAPATWATIRPILDRFRAGFRATRVPPPPAPKVKAR